jgi:hypothetical protein
MSKYQPESQAAKVSAKRSDSNGIGNGRGRAGPNSRLARNAAPFVSTWTLRTATRASMADGAHGKRASSCNRAGATRARPCSRRRLSHEGPGTAARTAPSTSNNRNGFDNRRALRRPRSKPPATRYRTTTAASAAMRASSVARSRAATCA